MFRKIIILLGSLFIFLTTSVSVFAGDATVLPGTELDFGRCSILSRYINNHPDEAEKIISERYDAAKIIAEASDLKINFDLAKNSFTYTDILGCGIKNGDIKLWMIPYYVRWVLEFVIAIAGLLNVLGLIYGGYLYLFAGISEDKDKGKNAIKNAVIGLVLTFTAWAIVSIIIALVTL